ncbi:unnamed protein product [Symbiodinium microadriaticum]|nr:unnamed protein product [Symbiodinium microadriaticum]
MSPPALSDAAIDRGDGIARPGSWAESSATYFSRQPLSPKDVDRVRTEFRQLCVRHYGSLVGAWKAMDVNSDGRLSYFEFLRFVSLQELDPLLAQQLGSLAAKLWTLFGSLEEAWRNCFNPTARLRICRDDFVQACESFRFRHGEVCFAELCSEKARSGMSRKEFGFLHTWLGRGPDRGFIDPPPSRWEKERRPWTPPVPRLKKFERRQNFKDCLLRSYGNFVRAWREGLDRDHNHKLDYHEFSTAVKDVGYPGNPRELWEELDLNENGFVSLWELDEPTAELLKAFVDLALAFSGTWRSFWTELLDIRGDDRVRLSEFRDACALIAFDGDVDVLFELLDTDKTKYLSWATTSWLATAELDEDDEEEEAAASAAGKSECAAGKVGALAELLVDDYARLGFARGSHVEVLEIVPGGLTDLEKDGLRALPARPAAVPEPLAQPVSRPPQTEEPLLHFLRDPSRLICLRLVRSSELGRLACNLVDAIHARLHSKGIWQSETWSAVASIKCFDGSILSAVGLGSNLKTRDRAVHLSLATVLTLELLKGCPADLLAATHQVMRDFPLLAALVKEARQIKERADEELRPSPPLPPTPTHEECYDFARRFMVFHENPNLWFSVGRIGGENVCVGSDCAARHFSMVQDQMPDFMKTTKSQRRLAHNKARDRRVRVKRFEGRARGEIPGSHVAAGTAIHGSTMRSPPSEPSATGPMEKSASAPGLTQASQSLSSHSYSAAWATAGASSSRVTGRLASSPPTAEVEARDVTSQRFMLQGLRWLLIAEGRARIPAPPPKIDLSFPFKPQEPGKGGWPTSKLKLTDELWGGSKVEAEGCKLITTYADVNPKS